MTHASSYEKDRDEAAENYPATYELMYMNADTPRLSGSEYLVHGFKSGSDWGRAYERNASAVPREEWENEAKAWAGEWFPMSFQEKERNQVVSMVMGILHRIAEPMAKENAELKLYKEFYQAWHEDEPNRQKLQDEWRDYLHKAEAEKNDLRDKLNASEQRAQGLVEALKLCNGKLNKAGVRCTLADEALKEYEQGKGEAK